MRLPPEIWQDPVISGPVLLSRSRRRSFSGLFTCLTALATGLLLRDLLYLEKRLIMLKTSPLAPEGFPELPGIAGLRLAGQATGLKKRQDVRDLFLAELAPGSVIAGILTTSRCGSAPVDWCRKNLPAGKVRGIVCNSGNANAFTGHAGDQTVTFTAKAAAELLGCDESEIFQASTGVIGQPVPQDGIATRLPGMVEKLDGAAWKDAAEAIMTTDTFPKASCVEISLDGVPVKIAGIAKGSGMIAPDMATMLAFIFTDAAIDAAVLQKFTSIAGDRSFNSITVDGDTSTSDTVLVAATCQAGNTRLSDAKDRNARKFARALEKVMRDLAQQIVRDGEGAQKFVEIQVTGAASARAARRIGLSIANSPLVKTAIAGEDANWGRIVMAVGKAGEKADRDKLSISMGGVQITRCGQPVEGYDEAPVAEHLKGKEIVIAVDVGIGRGKATVWTCDLTHGYIEINADYRS